MARFGRNTETIDPETPEINPTDEYAGDGSDPVTTYPGEPQLDPKADYTADPAPEGMAEPAVTPEVPEVLNGATAATRRGRPKLADLPPVQAEDLGGGMFVPEEEWDTNPIAEKQSQVRDAAQVKVDDLVKQVHDAWIKADKPGARTSPRARYEVKPEHAAGTRAMLTRAGAIHKVKVTPVSRNLPNGMVAIVFTVRDRDPKPASK